MSEHIFGIHSVQALLKTSSHRLQELYVFKGRRDQKIQKITDAVKAAGKVLHFVDKKALDDLCDGNHQGVVAIVSPGKTYLEEDLYGLVEALDEDPFLLILDGVTDPHNLGACVRSADAAGIHAVIIPKDNSAGLNDTVRKVASGAAENVPLVAVTNLARCMKKLQNLGVWITGLAGEADASVYDTDVTGPRALVMGAEGDGMRRLTKETCDGLVNIPMKGSVSSLNVSVATGVVLFEALRQRS